MIKVLSLFVVCVGLGLNIGHGLHAQSRGENLAISLRDNVVQIVAERADGSHDGFGFIVGERDNQVYIATANHVVRGTGPGTTASRILIRYYRDQEVTSEARLLGESSQVYDLAVLVAPRPNGLAWHRASAGAAERLQRGTPLWFVGRGGRWYVPTGPGKLNDVTLEFRIHVDGLSVQIGSSGAPLLSEDGIIGMIVEHEREGGVSEAISIDLIERAFTLWDLPWDLQPLVARAAIPALAPEVEMHLSAGDRFLETGQYSKAIEEYQAASETDSRNTVVLHRIVTAMRLKLWEDVRIPLELLPDVRAYHGYQEFASYADRALQVLYQAQGIDISLKNNSEWLLEEAYLRRGRGDWSLAVEVLEKARGIAPEDPEVLSELGLLLSSIRFGDAAPEAFRKQFDEGISLITRAVAIEPDNANYRRYLATGLALSDEEAAVREFYQAATFSKENDKVSLRNKEGALEDLETIFNRWAMTDYWRWGYAAPAAELPAAELVQILEHVRANSSNGWVPLLLAGTYFNMGNLEQAEHILREKLGSNLDRYFDSRFSNPSYSYSPHLVLFARILEQSASDPMTLLALRLYLGRQNILGVIVSNVNSDGPIYVDGLTKEGMGVDAGLQVGDVITKVDGEDTPTVMALVRALAGRSAGEMVEFEVERPGSEVLTLRAVGPERRRDDSGGYLGVFMEMMFDDPSWKSENSSGDGFIEAVQVSEDGPAYEAGIRPGDILVSLNGVVLFGPNHLTYVLDGLWPGAVVTLGIERDEKTMTLMATLAARPNER